MNNCLHLYIAKTFESISTLAEEIIQPYLYFFNVHFWSTFASFPSNTYAYVSWGSIYTDLTEFLRRSIHGTCQKYLFDIFEVSQLTEISGTRFLPAKNKTMCNLDMSIINVQPLHERILIPQIVIKNRCFVTTKSWIRLNIAMTDLPLMNTSKIFG